MYTTARATSIFAFVAVAAKDSAKRPTELHTYFGASSPPTITNWSGTSDSTAKFCQMVKF
jgi:hypothetical protein